MEKLFQLLFLWDTTIPNQNQQYCLLFNLGHYIHKIATIRKLLLIFTLSCKTASFSARPRPPPPMLRSVRYWCSVGGSRSCLYFLVSKHGSIDSCASEQRKQWNYGATDRQQWELANPSSWRLEGNENRSPIFYFQHLCHQYWWCKASVTGANKVTRETWAAEHGAMVWSSLLPHSHANSGYFPSISSLFMLKFL